MSHALAHRQILRAGHCLTYEIVSDGQTQPNRTLTFSECFSLASHKTSLSQDQDQNQSISLPLGSLPLHKLASPQPLSLPSPSLPTKTTGQSAQPSLGCWASLDLHVKPCSLSAVAKKERQWTSSPVRSKILGALFSMEPVGLQQTELGEAGSGAKVHRSRAGRPHGAPGHAVLMAYQSEQPGRVRQAPTHCS